MLRVADALRLCDQTQHAFAQAEKSGGAIEWMDLVEPLVERLVLQAFGYTDATMASGLALIRYLPNNHPDKIEFRSKHASKPDRPEPAVYSLCAHRGATLLANRYAPCRRAGRSGRGPSPSVRPRG